MRVEGHLNPKLALLLARAVAPRLCPPGADEGVEDDPRPPPSLSLVHGLGET